MHMNFNKHATRCSSSHWLVLLALLCLAEIAYSSSNKAKGLQDLQMLKFDRQNDTWILELNVGHKNVKLAPKIQSCRTCIKSSLCKVCDEDGENCENTKSCFNSDKQPKIGCDSSYCQKGAQYEDKARSIYGFEAQVFGRLGKNEQTLLPLVFANKLVEPFKQSGEYCLLDGDSSFSHGFIILKDKNIELVNAKVNPKAAQELRQNAFDSVEVGMGSGQMGFEGLSGSSTVISNADPLAYKEIAYQPASEYKVRLSLEQLGITVPLKMLQQLQAGITQVYFPTNKCRIIAGKIKCADQLSFGGFTQAMLQFRFRQNFVLSLPIHMLISSCAARACSFLLDSHESSDTVVVGSIFLESLAVEWELEGKKMWVHRLNNQWADPYRAYRIDTDKKGFMANMLTLLYHIFLYLLYGILFLAVLSLLVNCLLRWREVAAYVKAIASRVASRKKAVQSVGEEEEYFVSEIVNEPEWRKRRINKLEPLEDDI